MKQLCLLSQLIGGGNWWLEGLPIVILPRNGGVYVQTQVCLNPGPDDLNILK